MGDCQKCDLRVDFDRTVRLTFVGSKVTSDAGLLAYRELDESLGLTATVGKRLEDSRTGRNTRHALLPLIRQSIYSRLAGYEDVNDAERLCVDPAMRHIVGGRASQPEKMAASNSELGRFETEMLGSRRNLTTLMSLPGDWFDSVSQLQPLKKLILDMDSSSSVVRQSAGSRLQRALRVLLLPPAVPFQSVRRCGTGHAPTWQSRQCEILALCAVASDCPVRPLPDPEGLSWRCCVCRTCPLRQARAVGVSIRDPTQVESCVGAADSPHVGPASGTTLSSPQGFLRGLSLSGEVMESETSCGRQGRVARQRADPCVGFIVTNLPWQARKVVKFYNGRGTAEQWIKEGKNAVRWTRLSCQTFRANHARLQLFALAYNLGNFLRRLALPKSVRQWSLTTLKEKLVKIGAKVTRHAKYVTFQLAEVAVPRQLFASILERIGRLENSPALCLSG